MAGRCPACGEGGVFVSYYRVRPTCRRCGVRFERDVGSWLGAMVVAYAVAIVVVAAVAAVLIAIFGLFRGLEWVLICTAFLTVVLAYRPAKGWWLWWMWAAGFVTRDGEDEHALATGHAGPPGASGPLGTRRGDEQHRDDGERHQR
ncbi:MAG: DUF983 domain-containing protein [Trueperaceae bacterium]